MYLAVHKECKIKTAITCGRTGRGWSDSGASSRGQPIYNTTAKSKLLPQRKEKKNTTNIIMIRRIKMVVAG